MSWHADLDQCRRCGNSFTVPSQAGCVERVAHGEIVGMRGPVKARYLTRRVGSADLFVILPNVRESDQLTNTVFDQLVRGLQVEEFFDED